MKTIIAGSRHLKTYSVVEQAMEAAREFGIIPTEIVSGGCRGTDLLGEHWAKKHGIPIKRFEADWDRLGPAAGPIRNTAMAEYGEALVAIPMGAARGTKDMIRKATAAELLLFVWEGDVQ